MNRRKKTIMNFNRLVLAFVSMFSLAATEVSANYGQQQAGGFYPSQQPLQARAVFVQASTPVSVTLNSTLGSEFSSIGEPFTATLTSPVYAEGIMVAPAGSTVEGTVVEVTPAGRAGKNGSMDLRLNSVVTPSGQRMALPASVNRSIFELSADKSRAGHFAKNAAGGAAGGALAGLLGSAVSGGKLGRGTALGTAIGGGTGVAVGAYKKGEEFILKSGTSIPFLTSSPVEVRLPSANNFAPAIQQQQQEFGGGNFADPASQYRY